MTLAHTLPLWLVMTSLGCTDLDRFSTDQGESYCGSIIAGETFRAGFSPHVQMRLKLDAGALDGPGVAGRVSTFEAGAAQSPPVKLLDEAELRRIPAMESDVLSRLELGEGRLRT